MIVLRNILLGVFGVVLLLLLLILFMPVCYRLKVVRDAKMNTALHGKIKITWLLHAISVSFNYPEDESLKIRVLGICVNSKKRKKKEKPHREKKKAIPDENPEQIPPKATEEATEFTSEADREALEKKLEEKLQKEEEAPTIIRFFKKLLQKLRNIRYTILQICDKIKHIIKNVRYYTAVIQSSCFKRAFSLCKSEVYSLIKSVLPNKVKGSFLIGTGDPASTAQILAIHGMLYPFIGNHITVTPDFENVVIEGNLYIKGRITVHKALKTAIKIYFNKDVRRVLRLLKREAA